MAIKVNGTTVIDDSRNFTNIAGGFKTVNGTSVVGSGNISISSGLTDLAGGKNSGYLPSYGNSVPVGGVVHCDGYTSYLGSSVGSSMNLYRAEYGKSYTMNGNNYQYNMLTGKTSSSSGDNTYVINSGTWQIIPTSGEYGSPSSVICLRVS